MKKAAPNVTTIVVIDAVLFLLCIIGAYNVSQKAGFGVFLTKSSGHVVIQKVYAPPEETDLRAGDIITSVNGVAVRAPEEIEFYLDGRRIGESVLLEVRRDDEHQLFTVDLTPYYSSTYMVIMFVVGSLFFSLGVFVCLQRYHDRAARLFHWGSISVAVIILTTWGNYSVEPYKAGTFVRLLFSLAYVLTPVFFLHFTFVFPREKLKHIRWYYIPYYGIASVLFLWLAVTFIVAVHSEDILWVRYYLAGFDVVRLFFSVSIILAVISIQHSYYTAVEEMERRKLRWLMLGLGVSPLLYILLWQLPSVIFSHVLIAEEIILVVMSLIPITFAIAIIQYRLFNIDVLFYRTTVYAIVIGFTLLVYSIVVGTVASMLHTLTVSSSLIVSAGAAVIVALLFQPLRTKVQGIIDKNYFRVQYNYREALRSISDEIKEAVDVRQLTQLVVDRLHSILQVDRIGLLLYHADTKTLKVLACRALEKRISEHHLIQAVEHLGHHRIGVTTDQCIEPGLVLPKLTDHLFRHAGISLVVNMPQDDQATYGCLVLGVKKSGTRYSIEDIDMISSVTVQTGLALDRILLQKKLVLEHASAQRHEELSKMKSYFVSSVTHELKTPLTSIRLFAEMLRERKKLSSKKYTEYLEIIEGESERLQRLIDNVLDFSKIERGIKEYRFERVDLNEIVTKVLKLFQYQFMIHSFEVRTRIGKRRAYILGDSDALIEAIMNLLSNSIKYSYDKKYVAVITARRDRYAAVSVTDKGIGIAESDLKKIFKPFYRCQDQTVLKTSGSGLGLSLVEHIVHAHKGKIEVKSAVGSGSTFTLLFPREAPHETNSHRRR
jgi:signal transduction histidine kinase